MVMANKTFYFDGEFQIGNHEVEASYSAVVENDGIGPYEYWGIKGFDYGTDYLELDEITNVKLVRGGIANSEDEIPKCSNISFRKIGNEYCWWHERVIEANDDIVEAVENKLENESISELTGGDYPEPEIEPDYY